MTRSVRTWDARVDVAIALMIGSAIIGVLAYAGLIGSAAGSAAYALLALSLATFAWAAFRRVRRRSTRR